jgi:hypothetical protein
MRNLRIPDVEPVDLMAVLGVLLVGIALELRVGVDAALAWVGACLLVYAVLAARHPPEAET